jgi:hypothetical protein
MCERISELHCLDEIMLPDATTCDLCAPALVTLLAGA